MRQPQDVRASTYRCPGCGREVNAPPNMSFEIACPNKEDHDDDDNLVMWEQ